MTWAGRSRSRSLALPVSAKTSRTRSRGNILAITPRLTWSLRRMPAGRPAGARAIAVARPRTSTSMTQLHDYVNGIEARPHVPLKDRGGSSLIMSLPRVAPDGPAPSLGHGRRAVDEHRTVCVGLDTHKARIAVAVAEPGREGAVRFHGEIANQPEAVRRLIERLGEKHGRLRVCYDVPWRPGSATPTPPGRKGRWRTPTGGCAATCRGTSTSTSTRSATPSCGRSC